MNASRGLWRSVGLFITGTLLASCSADSPHPPSYDSGFDAGLVRQGSDRIPCQPRAVLQAVCQKCHARTLTNGAPFSLVDRSDIVDTVQGGTRVRELMIAQLESRHMPLAPETIDEEARMALLSWLYAGAYAVESQSCVADDAGGDQVMEHEESE